MFSACWQICGTDKRVVWIQHVPLCDAVSQDEDISLSLPQLLTYPTGIVTVVFEILALVAMAPFVIIELGSMQAYAGGWLSLWNGLDVLTYSLQVRKSINTLQRIACVQC